MILSLSQVAKKTSGKRVPEKNAICLPLAYYMAGFVILFSFTRRPSFVDCCLAELTVRFEITQYYLLSSSLLVRGVPPLLTEYLYSNQTAEIRLHCTVYKRHAEHPERSDTHTNVVIK